MSESAAVVLAAGRGARMGGVAKALLEIDGQTFLERIATELRGLGCEEILVVVAEPFAERVGAAAMELGLAVVKNPEPEKGMGSSVARGFETLLESSQAESAWLWPVDSPFARGSSLRALAAQRATDRICIPTSDNRGGHPIVVGRAIWPEMAACADEPEGARSVLRRDPTRVVRLELGDPDLRRDVDTEEDLRRVSS